MAVEAISSGIPPHSQTIKHHTSSQSQGSREEDRKVDPKAAETALLESLQRAKAKQLADSHTSNFHHTSPGTQSLISEDDHSIPRKREHNDFSDRAKASDSGSSSSPVLKHSKMAKASPNQSTAEFQSALITNDFLSRNNVISEPQTASTDKVFTRKAQQILKKAILALGPAYATVENQCNHMLCVITFNKADILLKNYNRLYIVDPGHKMRVEALPDPAGLFVAVVYKAENGYFYYKRWLCSTEADMIVRSAVNVYEMDVVGGM